MSFYAVANGINPGIYEDWLSAKQQVDGFSGALFKLFKSREEADAYIALHSVSKQIDELTLEKPIAPLPVVESSRLATLTLEQRAVFDALMEGTLVRSAITEEAERHIGPAGYPETEGGARADRDARTNDAIGTEHSVVQAGDVHRPALAMVVAGGLAH